MLYPTFFAGCFINPDQHAPKRTEVLDFVINRFFLKPFQTNNIEIVTACREFFGFDLPPLIELWC